MRIGINRQVVEVELAEAKFQIKIIPLLVEYLIVQHDKAEKEFSADIKNKDDLQVFEWNLTSQDYFLQMIEAILTANGYEFDRDWWMHNADSKALVEFIADCKMKDYVPDKKKQPDEA